MQLQVVLLYLRLYLAAADQAAGQVKASSLALRVRGPLSQPHLQPQGQQWLMPVPGLPTQTPWVVQGTTAARYHSYHHHQLHLQSL